VYVVVITGTVVVVVVVAGTVVVGAAVDATPAMSFEPLVSGSSVESD